MSHERVDFFISYNHNDLKWALWMDEVLNRNGYTTLFQHRDCPPGMAFTRFMHNALQRSERTIGVLSPHALEADYVQSEWENTFTHDASGKAGKLLLVRIMDCEPDGNWSRIAFLDLVGVPGEQLEPHFLKGIRGQAGALLSTAPVRRPMQHKKFVMGRFAGREAQLNSLLNAIRSNAGQGDSYALYALRGMGGVGKSRMAAELADRLSKDTAQFPGGVLWCNLLEETPEIATRKWLQALEVDGTDLDPASLFESLRQAIVRRRPLVVCDNVQHPDQTRELLVSAPGIVTLITTREERNIPVSAKRERVDTFTPEDAQEMVSNLLPNTEGEEVARLCRLCGYIPLFLEVACRAIAERRISIGRYAEALSAKGLERLEKHGLDQHDKRATVVFQSSYETLSADEQNLFALLSLFPGASFGTNFVQALLGVDEFDAEDLITVLESRSLLTRVDEAVQASSGKRFRFRFHDLVREFASRKISHLETAQKQLIACWTNWEFVERELQDVGAYELSGQYHRLSRHVEGSREFIAWYFFIRGQTHILADSPHLFFQQAFNEPKDSPVSQRAVAESLKNPCPRRWLEWINRPERFSPPACEQQLTGHHGWVYSVALTPDGALAVSGSADRTVRVWDLTSGEQVRQLEGHQDTVNCVVMTSDGTRAVSASSDQTLRVWDLRNGEQIQCLKGHQGFVLGVAVTPDGRLAASASADKTLRVWDLESGRQIHSLEGHQGVLSSVAITADGSRAISASFDQTLRVWDLASGRQIHQLEGHQDTVNSVAMTADGTRAVSASSDQTVRVWDLATGEQTRILIGHQSTVNCVAVTADGTRAVSTCDRYDVRVWDLTTGEQIRKLQGHQGFVLGVALTADGRRAVSASSDQTIRVWDPASEEQSQQAEGHLEAVNSLAMTADGTRAVSASSDQTVRLWDLSAGKQIQKLEGHSGGWVLNVAITPDGTRAVSASTDQTVRVWDLTSGKEIRKLEGHEGWVYCVAITPDGKRAVSASDDRTLRVWDLTSGEEVHRLDGHEGPVYSVGIPFDGTRAISASLDQTVRIWDLEQGCCLETRSHADFPGDELREAVGTKMHSARILSEKGIRIDQTGSSLEIAFQPGQFTHAQCSDDGRVLVAGVSTGEVRVYHLRDQGPRNR